MQVGGGDEEAVKEAAVKRELEAVKEELVALANGADASGQVGLYGRGPYISCLAQGSLENVDTNTMRKMHQSDPVVSDYSSDPVGYGNLRKKLLSRVKQQHLSSIGHFHWHLVFAPDLIQC